MADPETDSPRSTTTPPARREQAAEAAARMEAHLYAQIPITRALGVRVLECGGDSARLWAPLGPNVNHFDTAFGGSLAAVGILANWTLIHHRLEAAGLRARVVIQRSEVEFLEPLACDFEATGRVEDEGKWDRFVATLRRRGRARVGLRASIEGGGVVGALAAGVFVALAEGAVG